MQVKMGNEDVLSSPIKLNARKEDISLAYSSRNVWRKRKQYLLR